MPAYTPKPGENRRGSGPPAWYPDVEYCFPAQENTQASSGSEREPVTGLGLEEMTPDDIIMQSSLFYDDRGE